MTAKRFYLNRGFDTLNILDVTPYNEQIYKNKSSKDMALVVELLNTFNEENKKLREQVKCLLEDLQSINQINKEIVDDVREELLKENEQLKSDNKVYVKRYFELFDKYLEIKEENEQLKQQVQNIHKLIDKKITEVKKEYNKYSINSDQAEASIDTLIDLKNELN